MFTLDDLIQRPTHYHRDGTPIIDNELLPAFMQWGLLFETENRIVGSTKTLYGERLSTVFLGLDHAWGGGPPLIFETMLFAPEQPHPSRESMERSLGERWLKGEVFCEYYKLDPPTRENYDAYRRDYHRIRAAHGGEIKNLPREVWEEAVVVYTNGPGIPIQIQMAPYKEGPNDTIEWLPLEDRHKPDGGKSDMLTDWWS